MRAPAARSAAEYNGQELPYTLQAQLKYSCLNQSGGSYQASDVTFGRLNVSYDAAPGADQKSARGAGPV